MYETQTSHDAAVSDTTIRSSPDCITILEPASTSSTDEFVGIGIPFTR
jgi:hypothetical protein